MELGKWEAAHEKWTRGPGFEPGSLATGVSLRRDEEERGEEEKAGRFHAACQSILADGWTGREQ
jgi:hypothetical protein